MAANRARTIVRPKRPGGPIGDAFLADLARAYHEGGLTQEQLARQYGVSRSQVSRYLDEARRRDIVQIRIVPPESREMELEARLRDLGGLREAVVVRVFSSAEDTVRNAIARASARLLDRIVRPGSTICFGAGRTLATTVALLTRRALGVTVVQAMGNAGHEGLDIDYNAIAGAAAAAFGGRAIQINAPAIVGPGAVAVELEASNRPIHEALAMARRADLYVVGVGSVSGDQIYVQTGLISPAELADVADRGAVGDLCGNFYDLAGRPVAESFHDRVVGIRLADLGRSAATVACAGGEEKVLAIAGALAGRYVKTLVTDEHTARGVLELVASS